MANLIELQVFIPPSIETRFDSVYFMIDKFILNCDKMTNFARDKKADNVLAKLIAIEISLL